MKKKCFVISPIGKSDTEVRHKANYILLKVIRPALVTLNYSVVERIDELHPTEEIHAEIIHQLANADLVVADLTGLNANVMYEMGIRKAWGKSLIPLAPNDVSLPFDVATYNTILYPAFKNRDKLSTKQCNELIKRLRQQELKLQQKPSAKSPFAEVMKKFGEAYALDAVYRAMSRSLSHLRQDLQEVQYELNKDYELDVSQQPDALFRFKKLIGRAFTTLRANVDTLLNIAQDENDDHCIAICIQVRKLQKRGVDFCSKIRQNPHSNKGVGPRAIRNRKELDTRLTGMIHATQEIKEHIERRSK